MMLRDVMVETSFDDDDDDDSKQHIAAANHGCLPTNCSAASK